MILTLNAGSSSLKFSVFELDSGEHEVATGLVERIGSAAGRLSFTHNGERQRHEFHGDHAAAMDVIADLLREKKLLAEIKAVGHRVVHGGESFQQPTVITTQVEETIQRLSTLAPLHNPVNLEGILLAKQLLSQIPHVAVFDTAFHSTMPAFAFRYAVPNAWYNKYGVRKYGFHGTSHAYVSAVAIDVLAKAGKSSDRIITLHLGNGCSAAAIVKGKCVDTTMGLTPLEGLMMGTRSGDVDPGLVTFMHSQGLSVADFDKVLNKESGLLGIAAENDMRSLLTMRADGSAEASLAISMFVYRLRKVIGSFAAAMGGLDALIFTAGIGENALLIREEVCEGLSFLNIELSAEENTHRSDFPRIISTGECDVMVIPTNEELSIARATVELLA